MSACIDAYAGISPLLAPLQLNQLQLANRVVVAPMTRISATPAGLATDAMIRYYQRFAGGGFGLVITEGIYTDQAYSQGYANQPGLSDAEQAEAWRPVVECIHAVGGRVFAQLMHAGALSQFNRFRDHTIAPSAVRPKGQQMSLYRGTGEYSLPRMMDDADIAEAIAGFAHAAVLATEVARFDGVEIHGANGYLLDQFLTDYTNRRDDRWGGPIAHRSRLVAQVIGAVREAVGASVPVGVRISQGKVNDCVHKWPEQDAGATAVFQVVAAAGADYIHITEPEAWQPAFGAAGVSLVNRARASAPGLVVIANGGLGDPDRAAAALLDGADLIALGRAALANPDWPRRLASGRPLRSFDPALLSPFGDIKASEQNA